MRTTLARTAVAAGVATAIAAVSQTVSAAGFALIEHSASGMGNAFAGGAAKADDISTIWFNPAGMTRFEGRHVAAAVHYIEPSIEFTDDGSSAVFGPLTGGNGGDAGDGEFIPNLYWQQQVNLSTWFGLAINVPFGLDTEYEQGWVGRYHATKSNAFTYNINPSLAWKVSDTVSIGVGVSMQYIDAEIGNALDSRALCLSLDSSGATCTSVPNFADASTDSSVLVAGDDWNLGFNLGVLIEPSERTRYGFHYRSKIKHDVTGDADFTLNDALVNAGGTTGGDAANLFRDQEAIASVDLPASASASLYHQFGNGIAVMGDVTWTQWSEFEELRVRFPEQTLLSSGVKTSVDDSVTVEQWDDSFRYALGLDVPTSETLMLRFGVAFDETPVPNEQRRTPRIPDEDRLWYSFGIGWKASPRASVDFGLAYLDIDDTRIENTLTDENGNPETLQRTLRGSYSSEVIIGSVQFSYAFDN